MKRLDSREGDRALFELGRVHALLAFDFDGTLAPIVRVPDQARMATGLFRRLARLAGLAPVAVISGRSLSDLRPRIPPEVQLCVGNHGSEAADADPDMETMNRICHAWVRQLGERLGGVERDGILIENKGVTISVHYRLARDRALAERWITGWIEELVPTPRVIGGKFIFNLLPQQARTKYEALVEIAARDGVDAVLFVGDDVTDELVFAQAPSHWVTVRVERQHGSRARFYIHDQAAMSILLDRLIAMFEPQRPERRGVRVPP